MKNCELAEKIIRLKIQADRISWGIGDDKALFSLKYQILFLIGKEDKHLPKELIFELNLAKSNIALMCNKLCKEGLIEKNPSSLNKKQICYFITDKGLKVLDDRLDKLVTDIKTDTTKPLDLAVRFLKEIKR